MKPALRRIRANNSREVLNEIFEAIPDLLYDQLHRVDGCGQIMMQDLPMNSFDLGNVRSIEIENLTACELEEQNPLNILPTCSAYYVSEACDDSPYYKVPAHPVGVGAVDVYFDGYKLIANRDYREIDENHIRILQTAPPGTVIEFQIFSSEECSVEDVADCTGDEPAPTPPVYTGGAITSTPYPLFGIEEADDPLALVDADIYLGRFPSTDADFSIQSGTLRNLVQEHDIYDDHEVDSDYNIQSGTLKVVVIEHSVYDDNELDSDYSIQSGTLEVIVISHSVYDEHAADSDFALLSGSLTTP